MAKHGHHHRLHIKHKSAHRTLVEFKYEAFRDFISMKINEFDQKLKGRTFPCAQFATRTSPVFSEWHSRFYQSGRKVVPKDIAGYLSPLAVAVWFMDDGASDFAGVTFQTHSFTESEVEHLVEVLRKKFRLAANSRANRGGRIIYVKAASLDRLQLLIEPHLLSEFRYKLIARRTRTP